MSGFQPPMIPCLAMTRLAGERGRAAIHVCVSGSIRAVVLCLWLRWSEHLLSSLFCFCFLDLAKEVAKSKSRIGQSSTLTLTLNLGAKGAWHPVSQDPANRCPSNFGGVSAAPCRLVYTKRPDVPVWLADVTRSGGLLFVQPNPIPFLGCLRAVLGG